MAVKYVFVTGGVVSGLGKGITAASLGRLLKARGYTVTMQKFDPYINIDPGTMNPVQHGEVFVTDDGAETDLDLGHYERFIDESLTKNSNVTTGKIYWSVLQKERRGDFGGGTVQVIPHITNEIKSRFYRNPSAENTEIAIIEVGGTVGDIESQPFLEAIRQFQHEKGRENVVLIHVTLIPYLRASQEMKTKPTQASVKDLQGMGIQPDILVCRSEHPLDDGIKDKIALFCNVPSNHVLQNLDVEYLYEAPLAMEKEHLADLDLGHYERFIDESLTKNSNVTTGKIYWSVLQKERRGDFGGGTVQVIPHITNEIKSRFYRNPSAENTEIAIIEVGGTVGDIESQPFLEAIRQFQHEKGRENVVLIHVTLIPYLRASQEMKTKPTQASVKDLQGMGIQPDILVCRSEHPLDDGIKDKIALFCNVPSNHVLQNLDVEYLYEAPLAMEKEHLAEVVCESLHLDCPTPDLKDWTEMVEYLKTPNTEVTVAIVGKYIQLHDAYISVVEALKHGGIFSRATVNIKWIDSETVTAENVDEQLKDVSGILVPGGFGQRGIDGKLQAIKYARTNKIPFLGLCLGMQLAIVEFARNVIGYRDAHSAELDPDTTHPVIHIMPEQLGIEDIGGTLRLGSYPCVLDKTSTAYKLYGTEEIHERHRHRYEVNNDYRDALTANGMILSGLSPDGRIVEMIEIPEHPWFVATQAHPELKSRPNRPHPLFRGFVEAALKYQDDKATK